MNNDPLSPGKGKINERRGTESSKLGKETLSANADGEAIKLVVALSAESRKMVEFGELCHLRWRELQGTTATLAVATEAELQLDSLDESVSTGRSIGAIEPVEVTEVIVLAMKTCDESVNASSQPIDGEGVQPTATGEPRSDSKSVEDDVAVGLSDVVAFVLEDCNQADATDSESLSDSATAIANDVAVGLSAVIAPIVEDIQVNATEGESLSVSATAITDDVGLTLSAILAPVVPNTRTVMSPYGGKERELVFRADDTVASETTFRYGGRILSETKFLDDGVTQSSRTEFDALQNKKEIALAPDGITPVSEVNYRYDQSAGIYVQQSQTTFSLDGKTPESTTRFRFDGSKELEQLFAADGTTLFAETRFRSDGVTMESIRTYSGDGSRLIKYSTDGQLVEAHDFDHGQRLIALSRFRSDGTVASVTSYKSAVAGGALRLAEFEYATDGKTLTFETRYNEDGSTRASKIEYSTDGATPVKETSYENGRAIRVTEFSVDGKTAIRARDLNADGTTRSELSFEADGQTPGKEVLYNREAVLPVKTEVIFQNGKRKTESKYDALDRRELTREFDEKGQIVTEVMYWGTGSPRARLEYRDGFKISEKEYHAGTTQVRAETVHSAYKRTTTEFRIDGSMSNRKKFDWQQRLREEEIFDGQEKPLQATTYYDNGNKRSETFYGHEGSIQSNYENDGKRLNDLSHDRSGNVTAEMTYQYDGEQLVTSVNSSGKEYVYAVDSDGRVHRFSNSIPAILPMDLFTGIPDWRQQQLDAIADTLVEDTLGNGQIDFIGFGNILTRLGERKDLTEQEKANVWGTIVGRAKNADNPKHFDASTNRANPAVKDNEQNINIWFAILPFNDGYHGPLANLDEDRARNYIQLQERLGQTREQFKPTVGASVSIGQVAALRALLQGGMAAYAREWNLRFCAEVTTSQ